MAALLSLVHYLLVAAVWAGSLWLCWLFVLASSTVKAHEADALAASGPALPRVSRPETRAHPTVGFATGSR